MVFSWLGNWRRDQLQGVLVAIFVCEAAGAPMRRLNEARAVAGAGLAGDRYAEGAGHWKRTDACEVTLVTETDLHQAERHASFSFADGQHRRNLVVRGIPLLAFRRRQVRIGEVLLAFHRLRPPCGYLDRLLKTGAGKALGRGAGIGLRVIEGGVLRVGDAVSIIVEAETG